MYERYTSVPLRFEYFKTWLGQFRVLLRTMKKIYAEIFDTFTESVTLDGTGCLTFPKNLLMNLYIYTFITAGLR